METDVNPSDPYEAVLADLRAQRERIDHAIQAVEMARAMKNSGSTVPPVPAGAPKVDTGASSQVIENGAFFGMTIPEAVKKLLTIKKRNLPNADIAQGLETGGLVMQSENRINTINSVLTRRFQQQGDIVRVSRGVWGLREWHPNIRFKAKVNGEEDAEEQAEKPVNPFD
jgi:hypothetical protein